MLVVGESMSCSSYPTSNYNKMLTRAGMGWGESYTVDA